MNLKFLLLAVICYCHLIAQIKADCTIQIAKDSAVQPTFYINSNRMKPSSNNRIIFYESETIKGYCNTEFVNPQIRTQTMGSTLTFYCQHYNTLYVNNTSGLSNLPFECVPEKTFGTCSIQISSDKAVGPKFFKKLGTRTIQVLPEIGNATITISYDEEITAHCDTKFKSPQHQDPDLKLTCTRGRLLAKGHSDNTDYSKSLECESYKWNLYESTIQFPWCPTSMASYLLARRQAHSASGYEYLAGLCYDFDQMSVKSIYYVAKPKQAKLLAPKDLENFKPLMEISDVAKNFNSKKSFEYDNQNMREWLIFSNYINGVIVQYPRLPNDLFPQFDKMLTIEWWSGLKRGNWKFYEQALDEHIDNYKNNYDILAGVSNEVSVPMRKKDCSRNFTMLELIDSKNFKLPLYVWNYVRSLKNASDNVVVIGVNTPFVDFYDEKQLLFCDDICHTIDWLKDVHMTFHYQSMGIIICCTVDEVLASERLDGFAVHAEPTPPPLLTTWSYTAMDTTTEETVAQTEFDESYELYKTENNNGFYSPENNFGRYPFDRKY